MGKHRWKGELAKPIRPQVIRPRGLRVAADTAAKANKEMEALYRQGIEKEYLRKLGLLMDEYGITDKTNFFNLALALAIEHIPGFGIDPTPLRLEQGLVVQDNKEGRPPEWPLKRLDNLLSAVEETKKKRSLSTDHEALSVLAQRAEMARATLWLRRAGRHRPAWRRPGGGKAVEAFREVVVADFEFATNSAAGAGLSADRKTREGPRPARSVATRFVTALTSRRQRRLASRCCRCCSPAPTR